MTTNEDNLYIFTRADFPFLGGDPGDSLSHIVIESQPRYTGSFHLGLTFLGAGDQVSAADIMAGRFWFRPEINDFGEAYNGFDFRVSDGTMLSQATGRLTMNVTPVNDAPVASDLALTLYTDQQHVFSSQDISFTDVDGDDFTELQVDTVPSSGYLFLDGQLITQARSVTRGDLDAGKLVFVPNQSSAATSTSFTFRLSDGVDIGSVATASITLQQRVSPSATYGVTFTSLNDLSTPITSVNLNDEFYAVVDLSQTGLFDPSVYSTNVRLNLHGNVFSVVGTPELLAGFGNLVTRDDAGGLLQEVGGLRQSTGFTSGQWVKIRLRADAVGLGMLSLDEPAGGALYETNVYGSDQSIARADTHYGSAPLTVVAAAAGSQTPGGNSGSLLSNPFVGPINPNGGQLPNSNPNPAMASSGDFTLTVTGKAYEPHSFLWDPSNPEDDFVGIPDRFARLEFKNNNPEKSVKVNVKVLGAVSDYYILAEGDPALTLRRYAKTTIQPGVAGFLNVEEGSGFDFFIQLGGESPNVYVIYVGALADRFEVEAEETVTFEAHPTFIDPNGGGSGGGGSEAVSKDVKLVDHAELGLQATGNPAEPLTAGQSQIDTATITISNKFG
ncbi:MAG: Ig-like domain-containing protein, partial [Pirellulales bacterium]|nr:Ig-like domain-containing protein [Pirellulales bacterium]